MFVFADGRRQRLLNELWALMNVRDVVQRRVAIISASALVGEARVSLVKAVSKLHARIHVGCLGAFFASS